MKKYSLYIAVFLFMLIVSPLWGINNFFFSHLGVEDGLSQITVKSIFQDRDGFLWFGTRDGLNKYDGYEFKIYRNNLNDPSSLIDNYILSVNEDKNKNIWVATYQGLSVIDYTTGQITSFKPKLIDSSIRGNLTPFLFPHANGELYAITGTAILHCKDVFAVELLVNLDNIQSSITAISQDNNGDIYVGTMEEGIFIYTSDWTLKEQWVPEASPEPRQLPLNHITAILFEDDAIWLSSETNGLCRYERVSGLFRHFSSANSGLKNNTVRSLAFYNNHLLIGTFSGLYILNKTDSSISAVDINTEGGLSHYSIHSILVDTDNTVWIGTYSAGLNYYSPYHKPISFITANEYAGIVGMGKEDSDGNMWFATEGAGLLFFNPHTREQQLYPIVDKEKGNYELNIIKSVWIDNDIIYCGTHFGSVYSFSIRTRKYTLVYDAKSNDINTLFVDSKKRLWIPTHTSEQLVMISDKGVTNRFPANDSIYSFFSITAITEVAPDVFLLGAYLEKIYLYDYDKKRLEVINERIPGNIKNIGIITSFAHDSLHIWISTSKAGILTFDRNFNFIHQYNTGDGLDNNFVKSLVLDIDKNLWACTSNNIFKLNEADDNFYSVKSPGIPTQEFSNFGGSLSSKGIIYFPTNKGIIAFDPSKIQTNPVIPRLYITSFATNNSKELVNQLILDNPSSKYPSDFSISVDYRQSNMAIKYAALNYIHPEGNQYMYKMDGIDKEWNLVGSRREAFYNNISPGTYKFRVKAANNDGLWNPVETTLRITVLPPLYKTWWAYTLYIIAILLFSYQIYKYQHRKHELERDIRFRQKEQERMKELHDERIRMFNNFSHELRTPLTLIINPLEDILQNVSFSPEIKQSLQRMKRNTRRMLDLVNNLMDIQKYAAGESRLIYKSFDFIPFIGEIYQSFQNIADKRQIAFTFENELPCSYRVKYDEAEIEKVFFNLLSNAFKFTPSRGKIVLRVKVADKRTVMKMTGGGGAYLYMEVRDTGKGFTREEGEKIFEPFYRFQEDLHKKVPGTGIGLNLTRSIVEQHSGYIWAESTENAGTCFMLLLPDTEKQPETIKTETVPMLPDKTQELLTLIEEAEEKQKPVLLVVDDDEEIRQYIVQKLSQDFKVLVATNGKEGWETLQKHVPDIIISDVIMPGMNGVEFCKHVKSTPEFRSIPFILLTARSIASQIEEGLEAGADDYITKPFQLSLLKARIKNKLASSSVRKQSGLDETQLMLSALGIDIPKEKDEFLTQYIAIVKENIANPELNITLIHETLNMSRAKFYRKVNALTSLSPIELIRNIRLEVAKQLLCDTNLNISEIAQRTGFCSRSYFARNFKALYGISPREFQERNN